MFLEYVTHIFTLAPHDKYPTHHTFPFANGYQETRCLMGKWIRENITVHVLFISKLPYLFFYFYCTSSCVCFRRGFSFNKRRFHRMIEVQTLFPVKLS